MTAEIVDLQAWRRAREPLSAEMRQRYAKVLLNCTNKAGGLFALAQSRDERAKVQK